MEGVFIKLLNLSIQASILIVVVLLLRFILNKSPKWMKCLLWALVAIRLVCPFSIESIFSLSPDAEVVNMDNYVGMPNIQSEAAGTDRSVNKYVETHDNEGVAVEKKNTNPIYFLSIIWSVGIVILAVYALGSCLKIWRRVKLSIRTTENIYICDRIDSPFIFGIIKPRIYLPSGISEEQKESVIAHEQAHLKRLDHFWKPFGFCLLTVYWFNPLCWLAYILLCRDIELACDEKVIKNMDVTQKKIYSQVLLSFSESQKQILACPLAFGEVGVKERIRSILNYKKPAFWIIAVAIVSMIVTSVLFLTSPKKKTYEITFHIPAGCENQLVFSDEEISSLKKNISFSVGRDIGDTEIQLKGVEGKEEGAYDEPVYVTPGMSAKMQVERGAWYRVGIYASNDTSGEKTVHVSVKNVEVRIAANKETTAENEPLQDMIEVSAPTIDLSSSTGADGSTMYYADENMFIFGGYYGLFVYDVTKNQITRSVDLAPIGCNDTQGDNACEIVATEDGSKVLLSTASSNMMYVYSVADNQMWREPYNLDGYDLYRDKYTDQAGFDGKRAPYEKDSDIRFYCLVNDTTIGELGYAMDIQSSYHTIFKETNSIYHNVLSEVVSRVGLENAYSWNNTVEFTEDAEVLIKMANDETGEYEVYGIMSAEYGAFGLLLNDKIDGEDNWNFAYVPWFYSGAPDGQPVLEQTSDGKFLFTYVYAYDDAPLWRECILDCGYDTGYMELKTIREFRSKSESAGM
ncbi:MAG: M56 family metallopeptidase [Agathobacter sp.]|nr:M56 family metallopeptidase [Agathobacter sp.]